MTGVDWLLLVLLVILIGLVLPLSLKALRWLGRAIEHWETFGR